MRTVLVELEEVLRSKSEREKITPSEELVLQTCKSKSIRDFTVGFLASSAAVWTATRRLTRALRFNLSLGSGTFMGMWGFDRSLSSCIDRIMQLEGSRIQTELANIILAKHATEVSCVKLVSKHFFPEQVFSDLNPDEPIFRWRLRNIYIDSTVSQGTNERIEDGGNRDKYDIDPNQSPGSHVGDMTAYPLDCVFGYPEDNSEMMQSDITGVPPRRRIAFVPGFIFTDAEHFSEESPAAQMQEIVFY
ncbi:hypothetical protein OPV22_014822 [Ensete ventricosum]|uniref:Uncharacterized protein n=1 Tax=Ensete ventricosum TaxID=4639 RepID=A0AAV8R6W0_ENSVE|nr:hypothetical protein OPV22_014822 [Ensete ventricosum]